MTDTQDSLTLAKELRRSGKKTEAQAVCERLVAAEPNNPEALHFLAMVHHEQGQSDQAIPLLDRAIAGNPNAPEVFNNYATVLGTLGRHREALVLVDKALELRPVYAEALCNRGAALDNLERYDEAIVAYQKATEAQPDFAEAYDKLGHMFRKTERLQDAIAAFRSAIAARPNCYPPYVHLGISLAELGFLDEAIANYEKAIDVAPDQPEAHWNLSLVLLAQGKMPRGWIEYEWRQRMRNDVLASRKLPAPPWNGADVTGRTVLIVAEQGLGDTVQFIRYAKSLSQRGATVVVECQPRLSSLLKGVKGIDRIVAGGEPLGRFDAYVRLMSLPGIFGTTLSNIPADVPYIQPEPARLEFWRREINQIAGFKIGIAWQGNPAYGGDRVRSIPLRCFTALADCPGVRLISLQKNFGTEQLSTWPHPIPIIDLAPRLDASDAFVDTAAVLKCLDLLITSDSSIAHVAGALGIPVWVVLNDRPDWRWLLDREDTPWYPSMRLFRQKRPDDWDEVFARIASELAQITGPPATVASVTVPISPGELADKITILEIKAERIADPDRLQNVQAELNSLRAAAQQSIVPSAKLHELTRDLREVNGVLWDVEDQLRMFERNGDFGAEFVALARSVYQANDRRALLKRAINDLLGAVLLEEKEHPDYFATGMPQSAAI